MERVISNIKSIPGVIGSALFRDDGNLMSFEFPQSYEKNFIQLIGHIFEPIKDVLKVDKGELIYLCWEFENFLVFYYPVDGGWIIIISNDSIPIPIFTITMAAVASKFPKVFSEIGPAEDKIETASPETVEKVKEMEKVLTHYLGPATQVLLNLEAKKMGYSLNNIPPKGLKTLLDTMITKIPDNKKGEAFQKLKKLY